MRYSSIFSFMPARKVMLARASLVRSHGNEDTLSHTLRRTKSMGVSSALIYSLHTPVPAGSGAVLTSFGAEETINAPFQLTFQIVSDNKDIAPETFLHTPMCLTIMNGKVAVRHFHGLVRKFTSLGLVSRGQFMYAADLVPGVWFMSQTQDCRVFQNLTTRDILISLFDDIGVSDYEFILQDAPPRRDYTVQMNETDLEFAQRLIEEEGWFYFFKHEANRHVVVIADSNHAFLRLSDPKVRLGSHAGLDARISVWQLLATTSSDEVSLTDYDPEYPHLHLEATERSIREASGPGRRDFFRWPARSHQPATIRRRSRRLIEMMEGVSFLAEGAGYDGEFVPGRVFELQDDPLSQGASREYVLRSVMHRGTNTAFTGGMSLSYSNSFVAFPLETPWRGETTVGRPRVDGICSAKVIGPEGEEIFTDELGRVKLLFPWDRRKDSTPGDSVWARIVQPWAANGWGSQFIPRVGSEVAVAFVDGDIDRPIVVGCLYNGDNLPPFKLPAQKTTSGVRTRSTLGGRATDYNEISFDDRKGHESVRVRAQRNFNVEVLNDQTDRVGNNISASVGGSRSVQVNNGDDSVTVKVGNFLVKAELGRVSIEAMQSIELRVGQTSLTLDQTGLSLKGLTIRLEGGAMIGTVAPMTNIEADGLITLRGGIVAIN